MKFRLPSIVFLLALLRLAIPNLPAQVTATATLQGTVTDASGAVIPSASVKITNKANGQIREEVSNSAGLYSFNLLPTGTYEVRVSVAGVHHGGLRERRGGRFAHHHH